MGMFGPVPIEVVVLRQEGDVLPGPSQQRSSLQEKGSASTGGSHPRRLKPILPESGVLLVVSIGRIADTVI